MEKSTIILIDSVGAWPEHSPTDINQARVRLQNMGRIGATPKIYTPTIIWHGLDCRFYKTDITYKTFFENNNLGKFIKDESLEKDLVLVQIESDTVQINGVKLDFNKNCGFCPNVFHIHSEAVKLKDGRLVCDSCYVKVFDEILKGYNEGFIPR